MPLQLHVSRWAAPGAMLAWGSAKGRQLVRPTHRCIAHEHHHHGRTYESSEALMPTHIPALKVSRLWGARAGRAPDIEKRLLGVSLLRHRLPSTHICLLQQLPPLVAGSGGRRCSLHYMHACVHDRHCACTTQQRKSGGVRGIRKHVDDRLCMSLDCCAHL